MVKAGIPGTVCRQKLVCLATGAMGFYLRFTARSQHAAGRAFSHLEHSLSASPTDSASRSPSINSPRRHGPNYERKITSSRLNILTDNSSAATA